MIINDYYYIKKRTFRRNKKKKTNCYKSLLLLNILKLINKEIKQIKTYSFI